MTFGTVTNFDDHATVRFERTIGAPVNDVWRALTDAEAVGDWLAPARLDPRVGGVVVIDFGDDGQVTGTITVFEPPTILEYTWDFTGERESVVRFELCAGVDQTTLVLEHRLLPADQAVGYGAGWHAHLDVFTATVTGGDQVDWDQRFGEVIGAYSGH